MMIVFRPEDMRRRRRVVLKGRVVTVIDLAGSKAKIAEDGKWHEHKLFFPLTEEDITREHVEAIKSHIAGKSIVTIKPEGTGVHLVLEDNTRLDVRYSKIDGIAFSVIGSDGEKVL